VGARLPTPEVEGKERAVEGGNTKSSVRPPPPLPIKEAWSAACSSMSSSSNPSIPPSVAIGAGAVTDGVEGPAGFPAVERRGMLDRDDDEWVGSGRVDATLSASTRLRAKGAIGSV